MKLSTASVHTALGWALVLLSARVCEASASHQRLHQQLERKHAHLHGRHNHDNVSSAKAKRGTCVFPGDEDPNLVAITPDAENAGWAMSPDQPCTPGMYCPIACKPGMVMAQWDPDSKFEYPVSMNGGLYCNDDGEVEKPFPNKPYCVEGTGTIKAVNKAGKGMSWCQTVLPGNEAMLIPTMVTSSATLAVPDTDYWCETAAHFYINPPGTGEEGCIWGDDSSPIGNWSPYVAGANTDANGQTFVKLGWNPIFEESSLLKTLPSFGVKIECPDGGCNGLPCQIDPLDGAGVVDSLLGGTGAGGSNFCVVTVSKGKTAEIVAFTAGGGSSDGGDDDEEEEDEEEMEVKDLEEEEPETTSVAPTTSEKPTTSSTSTSTSTTSTTSTTSEEPSTTSTSTSSTRSKTSSAKTSTFSTPSPSSTSSRVTPTVKPGIFHENHNDTSSETNSSSTDSDDASETSDDAPATTSDEEGEAGRRSGSPAVVGLVVAFVAAACIL
jgi:hypothetical protein